MSLGFIATFQQTALNLALTFIIVAGMGDGIADVCLISPIQCEPDTLRLPVFSLMTLLQMTGFGVSMLIVARIMYGLILSWLLSSFMVFR